MTAPDLFRLSLGPAWRASACFCWLTIIVSMRAATGQVRFGLCPRDRCSAAYCARYCTDGDRCGIDANRVLHHEGPGSADQQRSRARAWSHDLARDTPCCGGVGQPGQGRALLFTLRGSGRPVKVSNDGHTCFADMRFPMRFFNLHEINGILVCHDGPVARFHSSARRADHRSD